MPFKTLLTIGAASDVAGTDLFPTWRSAGPMKSATVAMLAAYLRSAGLFGRRAITANDTAIVSDSGQLLACSNTITLGLSAAATLGSKWGCTVQNAGTGKITLDPNGSETIDGLTSYIMYPYEVRFVWCDGSALYSVVLNPFGYITGVTDPTFVWPPGYLGYDLDAAGAGGGGAAGCSFAVSGANPAHGGYPGAGGARRPRRVLASLVTAGSTVAMTIGAHGVGGVGLKPASADGNNGTAGGTTSIGSLVQAAGGSFGVGDNNAAAPPAVGGSWFASGGPDDTIPGTTTQVTRWGGGVGASGVSILAGCGGGFGGLVQAPGGGNSTASPGDAGGAQASNTITGGGPAGGAAATAGTSGTNIGDGGGGGGGRNNLSSGAAGAGGVGGPGGGGGGGGGVDSRGGGTVGSGGNGGDGWASIVGII